MEQTDSTHQGRVCHRNSKFIGLIQKISKFSSPRSNQRPKKNTNLKKRTNRITPKFENKPSTNTYRICRRTLPPKNGRETENQKGKTKKKTKSKAKKKKEKRILS